MVPPVAQRKDRLVCKCLIVGEREIRSAISAGARTVADVGQRCEAGTGCTACHPAITALLDAAQATRLRAQARRANGRPQLGLFGADKS